MSSEIIQGDNSSDTPANRVFNSTPMCLDLTAEHAQDYLEELESRKSSQIEPFPADLIDSATVNSNKGQNLPSKIDT